MNEYLNWLIFPFMKFYELNKRLFGDWTTIFITLESIIVFFVFFKYVYNIPVGGEE